MLTRILILLALLGLCLAQSCGRQCYRGTTVMANPSGATDGTSCDSATDCSALFSIEIQECGNKTFMFFMMSDRAIRLEGVEMACQRLPNSNVVVEIADQDNKVSLLWQYSNTDCDGILTMLSTPRGTFKTGQIKVVVENNIWSADLERLDSYEYMCPTPEPTRPATVIVVEDKSNNTLINQTTSNTTVPESNNNSSSSGNTTSDKEADSECAPTTGTKPIIPFVECSARMKNHSYCCTWFGYNNKGNDTVYIPVGEPNNFLTNPKSNAETEDNQPEYFDQGLHEWDWYVMWNCTQNRQEVMRWELQFDDFDSGKIWARSTDVTRNRNDCNSTWVDFCERALEPM